MRTLPRFRPLAAALFAAALALAATVSHAAITIGPGPSVGTDRAGVAWYEEFQDWTHADLKALDPVGASDAMYLYNDGLDDSRDLAAFYEREENNKVYFRVDVNDLALGAEASGLNLYVAIDCASGGQPWMPDFVNVQTDHPWELCLCVYQSGTANGTDYRIYDKNFAALPNGYLGSYFNSQLDAVELGIDRQLLLNAGWNGSSPLAFQVFTVKDNAPASGCTSGGKVADTFLDTDRGCSDGVLNGAILSTDTAGLVYYASIAHGNQSVNRAQDIGPHIYDSQANTGINGGTGFQRTLDTHGMFKVPLNIHPSGTLTSACLWAQKPGGAADPQDGPSFVARIRQFVDADQSSTPGSLVGGVYSEHILPYFEGPVNAAAIAFTDTLNQIAYGVSAADAKVMHTPERVIRSTNTGFSPLTGHTFADIAASPYQATVIDEVTHLHAWFYPGEDCASDYGYRHKLHKVNGVYCFVINDREDQEKFGNWDGGMVMDSRASLLQKAMYGNSSEIVVVFDDWEALAGKSFDPVGGHSVPNNNPVQYHNTIRWAANHPWIRISNLKDLLATAIANPSAFVVDHGARFDLPLRTYEYLMHSCEDSYDDWYYGASGSGTAPEQDFYHLVPVISGAQGDYHSRGASPANDGPGLPSGMANGDMNTPGALLHDTWATLQAAPAGRLRDLGIASFLTMIYETAWHEEDNQNYANSCFGPWQYPDASWDGVSAWALTLSNHVRNAGAFAAAARWADSVRTNTISHANPRRVMDVDMDGEAEYILQSSRAFAVFEARGGRCVLACAYDANVNDGMVVIGAPFTNPSAPGEEEYSTTGNRCSAFKDMNGGGYADAIYGVSPSIYGWTFTSPDGAIVKDVFLESVAIISGGGGYSGFDVLNADYTETLSGPLYVRLGLSPDPLDLARHGQANLRTRLDATEYKLVNTTGPTALVSWPVGVTFNATPSGESADRRNLALTEEVELSGNGSFFIRVALSADTIRTGSVGPPDVHPSTFAMSAPWPSPARGSGARFTVALPRSAPVHWQLVDVAGRVVEAEELGTRAAGVLELTIPANRTRVPGLYFLRVTAGNASLTRRWVVAR